MISTDGTCPQMSLSSITLMMMMMMYGIFVFNLATYPQFLFCMGMREQLENGQSLQAATRTVRVASSSRQTTTMGGKK